MQQVTAASAEQSGVSLLTALESAWIPAHPVSYTVKIAVSI